jgi:hypothetical protein
MNTLAELWTRPPRTIAEPVGVNSNRFTVQNNRALITAWFPLFDKKLTLRHALTAHRR